MIVGVGEGGRQGQHNFGQVAAHGRRAQRQGRL